MRGSILIPFMALILGGCQRSPVISVPSSAEEIAITSVAFAANESIPVQYTCDGGNISPPLMWAGVPETAQSLVMIMDDPDAPGGTFVHWVVYNLPVDLTGLDESVGNDETLIFGGLQGKNDFRAIGYGGPCPPSGTHRYVFKLYAVDVALELEAGASKTQVLKAIDKHIIGFGELVGVYARP